jgi:flagellar assembly protein FliH
MEFMLISPLTFKEFEGSSLPAGEIRRKPFSAPKIKDEEPAAPPPPPTFSEEELKAAERDAYQRGFLEGIRDGKNQAQSEQAEVERILAGGLENFVKSISPIFSQYKNHCRQLKQDMPVLALSIAKKVAGAALSDDLQSVIEAAAEQCLEIMVTEPKITVTVNSRLAGNLTQKLQQLSGREKTAASIEVIADANIAISDYRIEWKNGSIERSVEKLWQHMDKAIGNMLSTIENEPEEQLDFLNSTLTQKE